MKFDSFFSEELMRNTSQHNFDFVLNERFLVINCKYLLAALFFSQRNRCKKWVLMFLEFFRPTLSLIISNPQQKCTSSLWNIVICSKLEKLILKYRFAGSSLLTKLIKNWMERSEHQNWDVNSLWPQNRSYWKLFWCFCFIKEYCLFVAIIKIIVHITV